MTNELKSLAALILLVLPVTSCTGELDAVPPSAKDGILDLRGWSFRRDGAVELRGEWRFIWMKDGARFSSPEYDDRAWGRLDLPGYWNKKVGRGDGFGWLRLRIKLPAAEVAGGRASAPRSPPLSISMGKFHTSYALYANGELVMSCGAVGTSKQASTPQILPQQRRLPLGSSVSEVVIAIKGSNFFHRSGGPRKNPRLGLTEELQAQQWRDNLLGAVVLGIILMMGIYHLLLWFGRREDSASLYFGLFCLLLFVRMFEANSTLERLFPAADLFELRYKIEYLFIPSATVAFSVFFHKLYPDEFSRRILRAFQVAGLLLFVFALSTRAEIYTKFLLGYLAIVLLACAWAVVSIIIACRNKRDGAKIVLLGFLLFLATVVNDILSAQQVIYTGFIVPIGLVLFIFAQSAVLSMRFARAFRTAEHLGENLQKEVLLKTLDLEKQTEAAIAAKAELEQAHTRLTEHDRLKSRFFANVSHELRTPLTLILTPLERLLSGGSSSREEERRKLRSMANNTQRLLRLVNQLLNFARIESGGSTVAYELRDIRSLVESVVQGFEPFARSKGLKLEVRSPEDLPAVYVDPTKLDKVICNLLSNACKFTESGGSVVVKLSSDERSCYISVIDTGIGISEVDLPRIFERFRQVDGGASRQYEGTGIGLSLSKELTEIMGGRIDVKSEPGIGTTFTVALPRGQAHIEDEALIREQASGESGSSEVKTAVAALQAEVGASADPDAGADASADPDAGDVDVVAGDADADAGDRDEGRPLVLVVEDNQDMRSLVREICQQDFQVVEAADGQEALERIQRRRPDLVISDIMMPRMDGDELLRRIRGDPDTASIPVVLLTAKAGLETRLEGLESGADDYLTKPFESRELLARAKNLIRLQEQERALKKLSSRLQQEVVAQASELERARMLSRYLSPSLVHSVLKEGEPVQAGHQRRRITVFRLELRYFEDVAKELEAEDMAAMLNGYISAMTELAFSNNATIDTVVLHTIGGFFGAPRSAGSEQDALRCAAMAVEMWQRAVEICEEWRPYCSDKLPAPSLVMTSGFASVGNFGSSARLEYTAMGGPVNEANRLLPLLRAGGVYCSQSAWALIQGEVEGELCGSVRVDASSSPVNLYQLAEPLEPDTSPPALSGRFQLGPEEETASRAPGGTAAVDLEALRPGMLLANRYEVVSLLGRGGMGTVYRVRDKKLSIDVAVKLLRRDAAADPSKVKRLYKEVRLTRLVTHPNVARIFHIEEWEGHEFITMEHISGQTLARRIKSGGPLSVSEGLEVLRQICSGLSAAHLAGVIHRDLKPSNIMLEPEGRVVILDFGIARWVDAMSKRVDWTETDTKGMAGTPVYMSPEQFEGGKVDQRTDIYALGVVAYEMFTGTRPFHAGHLIGIAYQHTFAPPRDPQALAPDLPPRLAAVILRCLEKLPANRFNNVNEITAFLGVE